MAQEATQDLETLVDQLSEAAEGNGPKVSIGDVVDKVGRRSFGPLLLLGGLLGMSPLGLIPTAPSIIAAVTLTVSVQLIVGRQTVWIPRFLRKVSVKSERLARAAQFARRPARIMGRVVRPRLPVVTRPPADRLAAVGCALAALATPPLELVPFAGLAPAFAVAAFGLSLIARDGVVSLIAFASTAGAAGLVGYTLLR